ncbi:MAG: type IX secretion system protein PorQ [Bacteroidales bacterium]|nr:type IX secretion system protein PorQ [Bacteroidales bacterium]
MRRALVLFMLLFATLASRAQVAGLSSYAVLDMPSLARTAGLGFDFLSIPDNDIAVAMDNPSLITPAMHNQLAIGMVNLYTGATFGSASYCHHFKQLGTFSFSLQFDSYGRFQGYDQQEQFTGSFSAADYVFSIGWGRKIDDHVAIGANFKPILSHYEDYSALAFGIDLAATYHTLDNSFYATLMGRNIGAQILTFYGSTETLPFEISVAGSYKLERAPFRLMFAITELQRWQLAYEDPFNPTTTTDPFTGIVTTQSPFAQFLDNAFRHLNVGIELSIRQNFYATLGYSYRQMVEMRAAETFNLSGFSFGFGVNVKGFKLAFSRNNYHLVQAPNFISVTTSLERFFRH